MNTQNEETNNNNNELVTVGEIKLSNSDLKQALVIKTAETMGFKYLIDSRSGCRVIQIFLDDTTPGGVRVSVKPKRFNKKGIEVPRDIVGNKVLASKANADSTSMAKYTRFRTPKSIQWIDKKATRLEVATLCRLRDKTKSPDVDREFFHLRRVESQKLGEGDFTKNQLSFKEACYLLEQAKIGTQGGSMEKKVKWIQDHFEVGPQTSSTFTSFMNAVGGAVMKSDIAKKFLNGEAVDMNYSLRYYRDVKAKNLEPVKQYL